MCLLGLLLFNTVINDLDNGIPELPSAKTGGEQKNTSNNTMTTEHDPEKVQKCPDSNKTTFNKCTGKGLHLGVKCRKRSDLL